MQENEIKFKADKVRLQTFIGNTDQFRVLCDTGIYEWDKIKDIPNLPEGVYEILIKPVIE